MRLMKYIPLLGLRSSNSDKTATVVSELPVSHASHHGHQHSHKHVHPTQQAYAAHLQARTAAQIRIAQNLRKRDQATFRPLILSNHLAHETVYPGYSSKQKSGGMKLAPGESVTVQLPLGEIDMLRIWVRRGCTEGSNKDELHCLTGDCNGKLECDGWGSYGSSQLENAFYPAGNPPGAWLDGSNVEGSTMLPLSVSMDGCMTLTCDTSHISCPKDMQIVDKDGTVLACACGHSNWQNLQKECPDQGMSDVQRQWKEACPEFYAYSTDDLTSQKYCPYEEANAMRIDIGQPSHEQITQEKEAEQIPVVTKPIVDSEAKADSAEKSTAPCDTSKVTPLAVWGPGVEGFDAWAKTYVWQPNNDKQN